MVEITKNELIMLQSLPLEVKVAKTEQRIKEAIDYFGADGLYTSFSGGKDSTVLHHLVKNINNSIPSVFCDTGLEYPELRIFANKLADVSVKPTMSFVEIIKEFGYPVVSKEIAKRVYYARRNAIWAINGFEGLDQNGEYDEFKQRYKKYKSLVDVDFNISHMCCDKIKKDPLHKYGKAEKRIPIIGTMAGESQQRQTGYLKTGCNFFESDKPISKPLGFWREQDILQYIKINNIEIAIVYGNIVEVDELDNQCGLFEDKQSELKTTGCDRTGCVFCMLGCHMDKEENNRFLRLRKTHPKLYKYCMGGGEYNESGKWIPSEGLGMAHVLDVVGVKYK